MSNRLALICAAILVATVITLAVIGGEIVRRHSNPKPKVKGVAVISSTTTSSTTTTTTQPAPIPSTPDTAAPTIPRRPTTTTTLPEPEPPAPETPAGDETVSLDDPDMDKWRQIALCEMPGPGGVPSEPWGAHWTFVASRFSGALGIANTTWRAFGGLEYGPTAGNATWQQQIIVARRIRDRHGYSAWGCG